MDIPSIDIGGFACAADEAIWRNLHRGCGAVGEALLRCNQVILVNRQDDLKFLRGFVQPG